VSTVDAYYNEGRITWEIKEDGKNKHRDKNLIKKIEERSSNQFGCGKAVLPILSACL
jgi:hypothetical protein